MLRAISVALPISRRPSRDILVKEAFRRAAAEQHRHAIYELAAIHQEMILDRPLQRVAEARDAMRYDRYLLNRVDTRQHHGDQGMAHFMMGDHIALMDIEQPIAFLEACDDPLNRQREMLRRDSLGILARGDQRRLIDDWRDQRR